MVIEFENDPDVVAEAAKAEAAKELRNRLRPVDQPAAAAYVNMNEYMDTVGSVSSELSADHWPKGSKFWSLARRAISQRERGSKRYRSIKELFGRGR
jgi:hypothetical protein